MSPPPIDAESLLAMDRRLRRFARALLLDPEAADDVTQQAWVIALEHGETQGALHSWLGGVVKRLAWKHRAREARRAEQARNELDLLPERATPSTAELVERETARRRVVDAVIALDEPYRSAVALRYFEELDVQQIASRLGVPVETVRTRLKRGLERVRTRLDREHGGDGQAWCAALAPLAGVSFSAAGTAAGSGAATSMAGPLLFMSTQIKVLAAAVCIVAASLLLWYSMSPQAAAPSEAGRVARGPIGERAGIEAPAGAGAAAAGESAARTSASAPAAVRQFDAALAGISGRIVEPDGRPIAGAPVAALGGVPALSNLDFEGAEFWKDERPLSFVESTTKSGEDGRFLLRGVHPMGPHALSINSQRSRPVLLFVEKAPQAGEIVDLGDVVLPAISTIRGRALDSDGNPLAGARVTVSSLPGPFFAFGFGQLESGAQVILGGPGEDRFVLTAPKLVDAILQHAPSVRARTASDGTFEIIGVPAGSLTLELDQEGVAVTRVSPIPIPAGEPTVRELGDIELTRAEPITLHATYPDGKPAAGVAVAAGGYLSTVMSLVVCRETTKTDAAGRVVLRRTRGEKLVVATRAPDACDWQGHGPIDLDGEEVKITIANPRTARVRVFDAAGQPAEAEIAVRRSLESRRFPAPLQPSLSPKTEKLAPGEWRLQGLPPGTYEIVARAANSAPVMDLLRIEKGSEASAEPVVTLSLVSRSMWTAHVVDEQTRQPVAQAAVIVSPGTKVLAQRGLRSLAQGATDENGDVPLRVASPDKQTIHVLHPGYSPARFELATAHGDRHELALAAGGAVEGVILRGGTPVEEPMAVTLTPHDRTGLLLPVTTHSGPGGRFRFAQITPGGWHCAVTGPAKPSDFAARIPSLFEPRRDGQAETDVTITNGVAASVELDLEPTRAPLEGEVVITGSVTRDGAPLVGARVEFTSLAHEGGGQTETNGAGAFEIRGHAGTVQLQIMDRGTMLAWRQYTLLAGDSKRVDIALKSGGDVRGTVRSKRDGKPVAGADVQVLRMEVEQRGNTGHIADISRYNTNTNERGDFAVENVVAGEYQVTVMASGHAPALIGGLQRKGGASESVEILLDPSVPVAGRVELVGCDGAKKAWITVHDGMTGTQCAQFEVAPDKLTFELTTLKPGKYFLSGSVWLGDKAPMIDGTRFEIPAEGTRDLVLKVRLRP